MKRKRKVAIIGGGASGLCLAGLLMEAGGFAVDIFEQSGAILRKLRASGGGRCNFTNKGVASSHYLSGREETVRSVLAHFSYEDCLSFFGGLGVIPLTRESGMTYPSSLMASTLADTLAYWAVQGGAVVHLHSRVTAIQKRGEDWFIEINGDSLSGSWDAVVLASGGAYGLDKKEWSNGYSLVKGLGHGLTPPYAGIVSLCCRERDFCRSLSGLKQRVSLSYRGRKVVDDLLLTDYGVSGTGVFRLSNWILADIQQGRPAVLSVDWLPEVRDYRGHLLRLQAAHPGWTALALLSAALPENLNREIGHYYLSGKEREMMGQGLDSTAFRQLLDVYLPQAQAMDFHPTGSRKRDHGQISCGGIRLDDIDPVSLQSNCHPGLFFSGEVLDVQGECGGYNLHWAWASAHAVFGGIQEAFS